MAFFKRTKKPAQTDVSSGGEDTPTKEETAVSSDTSVVVAPKKEKKEESPAGSSEQVLYNKDLARVLKQPRITEKATFQSEKGVYVFEIDSRANKTDVLEAIKRFYKVTPRKVNITKIPPKTVVSRTTRKRGIKPGGKKAYVYLKEGDKLDLV